MAHQPNRPFESFEWYRDAARRGFEEDDRNRDPVQWITSFALLRAHVSVYAVAIVLLLAINLLRSPERIWADRWIMAWTVLLLIHAVGAGIVWALRQWNADDPDEPLQVDPSWRQSPMFAWGAPGETTPGAHEVPFRVSTQDGETAPPPAPGWNGWADVAPQPPPASERASWSEASAAAWLERRSRASKQEPAEPNPESKAGTEE
jgi:hypothetical protein